MFSRRTAVLPPFALIAALLFAPAAGNARSILGSAGAFTLLGGSAITGSAAAGTVISNGNVGLSPADDAAITGFPPATLLNGAIIPTGQVTALAMTDVATASAGLAAMAPTVDLTGQDLGSMTLLPGVYAFDGGGTLDGALTLDANGEDNAVWVFQFGTTLITSVNSSVTVINLGGNGGTDDGIFWNAGSAITIGADNTIAGNYLAGTSITFGSGVSGGGRALAQAAISLDGDQIDAQGGPNGTDWSGGLMYADNGSIVPVAGVIPEPAAILWLTPLAALGFALSRRRSPRGRKTTA